MTNLQRSPSRNPFAAKYLAMEMVGGRGGAQNLNPQLVASPNLAVPQSRRPLFFYSLFPIPWSLLSRSLVPLVPWSLLSRSLVPLAPWSLLHPHPPMPRKNGLRTCETVDRTQPIPNQPNRSFTKSRSQKRRDCESVSPSPTLSVSITSAHSLHSFTNRIFSGPRAARKIAATPHSLPRKPFHNLEDSDFAAEALRAAAPCGLLLERNGRIFGPTYGQSPRCRKAAK